MVLLWVVEGNALLRMRTSQGEFSHRGQRIRPEQVGLQEEAHILCTLGQMQELLS
jgi:hypothetical protein